MIAPNSTSYPYLAVAESFGVPYSMVLAYVDALDATAGIEANFYCIGFAEASKYLRRDVQTAILNAWRKECDRRKAVQSADLPARN